MQTTCNDEEKSAKSIVRVEWLICSQEAKNLCPSYICVPFGEENRIGSY